MRLRVTTDAPNSLCRSPSPNTHTPHGLLHNFGHSNAFLSRPSPPPKKTQLLKSLSLVLFHILIQFAEEGFQISPHSHLTSRSGFSQPSPDPFPHMLERWKKSNTFGLRCQFQRRAPRERCSRVLTRRGGLASMHATSPSSARSRCKTKGHAGNPTAQSRVCPFLLS